MTRPILPGDPFPLGATPGAHGTNFAVASAADGVLPHRFLVFPDEGHWVLKPQHTKIWYESIFAFLAQTVHGRPWEAPDLLR